MATIKVEQGAMNELKSAITFAAEQTSQAANMVSKAIDGMSGMSFSAKPGLDSELTSLKNRLNQQARLSQSYCRAVQETVDAFTQVDDSARTSAEGVWRKAIAISGAAVGSAVTAEGLSFFVKERLKKMLGINGDYIDGTSGATSTSTPNVGSTTISADSVLRSSEYDWIRQYDDIYSESIPAQDGGWHQICDHNTVDTVSCTFYTIRKLRERGLGFPFASSSAYYDGKDWYDNCIKTDDVPKAPGEDAIETLLSGRGSLENVVVSFPASAGNECGHVMLIDKVFQDPLTGKTMVTFSDNYDWANNGGYLNDVKGYTKACTWTLEYFKQTYITLNGGMNGAVLIGS